jgi:MFS family permease
MLMNYVQWQLHYPLSLVCFLLYVANILTAAVGPIAGELADRYGSEFVVVPGLLLSLPWLPILILDKNLPAFIVFFAIGSE